MIGVLLAKRAAPLPDRFIGHDDAAGEQQLFDVAVAETEAEVQPNAMADDLSWKAVMLVSISRWCAHEASIAHRARATQVAQ